MGKLKSGDFEATRAPDEMREVDVTLDFTDNALASVLYRQGETTVLACATKADRLPRWFPRNANPGWVPAASPPLPAPPHSRLHRPPLHPPTA